MENGPERQQMIDQMVEIFRKDVPWATGFHPKVFGLYHRWYENIKPNHMAYNTLKYVRINPHLRNQERTLWNNPIWWPVVVLGILFVAGTIPAVIVYWKREQGKGEVSE
jgi:hypothetical protein